MRNFISFALWLFLPTMIFASNAEGVKINKEDNTLKVVIQPILFDFDQFDIKKQYIPTLNSVAEIAKKYAQTNITIAGHTDNIGSDIYNKILSQKRTLSVAEYLTSRNIGHERIFLEAYGESSPIASNMTPGGRAQNRRAQVSMPPIIIKKDKDFFSGFYIGAGLGISHGYADMKNTTNTVIKTWDNNNIALADIDSFSTSFNAYTGNYGFADNIFMGIGKKLGHKFYFGLEMLARYVPTTIKTENETNIHEQSLDRNTEESLNINTSAKMENDYSLAGVIRLGYIPLPRTMIYILGGVDYSYFETDVNQSIYSSGIRLSVSDNTPPPFSRSYEYNFNQWEPGLMSGIGIEIMINPNLSLRGQYTHSIFFDSITGEAQRNQIYTRDFSGPTIVFHMVMDSSSAEKINDISKGVFSLDLTYHFNGM